VALASVGGAPDVEGVGIIRVEPNGLVEVLNGAVELGLESVGTAPGEEGYATDFLRLVARLDHRRAASDREVWIGGLAPQLIGGLRAHRAAEAHDGHHHE
jgi:hypothetical protein